MPKADNAVAQLASLLEGSAAKPVIIEARLAPSAIYDVEYRTVVVALVFEKFSKPFGTAGDRRILSAKLKLLQFVAFRPWLLSAIEEWSEAEKQGSIAMTRSMRIRRGFLSDTAHEDVINLLVACGVLVRSKSHLVTGPKSSELTKISKAAIEQGLFSDVQEALSELEGITFTSSMLEGW